MSEHIQIGAVTPRIQHTGDGVTTTFVYPFPVFAAADLTVYLDDTKQTTGFTVNGAGASAGGDVVFDAAPAAGVTVTLARDIAITRTSDFQEGGEFRASVLNDELDYLTAALQQVADRIGRTVTLSPTDPTGGLVVPDVATRANRYVGFDGTGQLIAAVAPEGGNVVSTFMATVLDDADAGAARATLGAPAQGDVVLPNRLINGVAPFVNQRGNASGVSSTGYFFADRWRWGHVGSGVVDLSVASVGGVDWLQVNTATADTSIGATELYEFMQNIELANVADLGLGTATAATVTLSFKHRHTKAGTYCVSFCNSGQNRSYVAEYTQDVADQEETAVISVDLDTSGDWTASVGLRVRFVLTTGSSFQTTANSWAAGNYYVTANQVNAMDAVGNKFRIRDVQLAPGAVATAAQHVDYATKLQQCRRYYRTSYNDGVAPGTVTDVGACWFTLTYEDGSSNDHGNARESFSPPMRAAPTVTIYNPVTGATGTGRISGGGDVAVLTRGVGAGGVGFYQNANVGTAGENLKWHYAADAEL